jgi:peptidoglycan biosynthesis protein MviN/MurJ (putative lipid II flippase)
MVAVNFALNLTLVFVLEERGLALATAVCALTQVLWLSVRLERSVAEIAWQNIGAGATKMLTATALMAAGLAILVSPDLAGRWMPASPAARLLILVGAGILLYAAAANALRIEEWQAIRRRLRRS